MRAWHLFWRTSAKDCFCAAHTPLTHHLLLIRFTLCSAPSSSSSLLLLRSIRPEVFHKKVVLRNFAKFTRKHLRQRVFFNKVAGLRLASLSKRGSGTGIFLWILRNFSEHLLLQNTCDGCFWILLISPMFVFDSNSKDFKEFKSGILFPLKSL